MGLKSKINFFLEKVSQLLQSGAQGVVQSLKNIYNGNFPTETASYSACIENVLNNAEKAKGPIIAKIMSCN